ncbi:UNKNOWN [Stylonychia lemnae]|uniref:Uncharacterized protein n=1 Tax=Stylonychia lemnae TaxID=5949 RepID=A0A078ABH3_STYLE|nr:UNKNOWN [Stylonychia lemnae]|eukprot:CDW79650.1 UNKNOWN [Stylonychia lemnae]
MNKLTILNNQFQAYQTGLAEQQYALHDTMLQQENQSSYYIQELTEKDFDEYAELVGESFEKRDCFSKIFGTKKEAFVKTLHSMKHLILESKCSFLARHKQTNEIGGGQCGIDYLADHDCKADEKVQYVLDMLDKAKNQCIELGLIDPNLKYLDITWSFSREGHENQGLQKILSRYSDLRAKEKGYDYTLCEATHQITLNNALKVGYELISLFEPVKFFKKEIAEQYNIPSDLKTGICIKSLDW